MMSSSAARNALALGARVHVVVGDVAGAIAARSMDLIVSNPPYVPLDQRDGLQREVRDYERTPRSSPASPAPRSTPHRGRLLPRAAPGGCLIMELGFGREPAVREMLEGWCEIEVTRT